MSLVMYTTTRPVVCCDASHVGSLDTLHATDGLVDTIPGVSRCTIHATTNVVHILLSGRYQLPLGCHASSVGSLDTLHGTDGLWIHTGYL